MVLDCFLAKDGGHRGALASSEDRARASLVLKQVPVLDDGSLEDFTDFQGGTLAQDDPTDIFEASGKILPPVSLVLPGSLHQDSPGPDYSHTYCLPLALVFSPQFALRVCPASPQWTWSRFPRRRPCSMLTAAGRR